ncbi:MAG: HD domain-containing protein [Pseudomonadota bacterium]
MHVPDETDCLALLRKYKTPEHIVQHSQRVWEVARVITHGLSMRSIMLDMDLVRASSLLHDIAKYPCIVAGRGYHDVVGEEMLNGEGLPSVALIVVQHVILRNDDGQAVREEHVVHYSDKRVVHDKVVDLEERFDYLLKAYGKTARAQERLMEMKDETKRLEERIFRFLDFTPNDLLSIIEATGSRSRG